MLKRLFYYSFQIALVCVLFSGFSSPALAECDDTLFGGGDGSEAAPYLIITPTHLDSMRECLNGNFVLGNTIDLGGNDPGGPFWNSGEGWVPVGTTGDLFTGALDGNDFEITGLFINRSGTAGNFSGLFGRISGAEISNLTIADANVTGNFDVGVLAGEIVSSNISNVHTSGSVNGEQRLGGVSGNITGTSAIPTEISNSSSSADVGQAGLARNLRGGFAGRVQNHTTIENSFASGDVSGSSLVGGFAGDLESSGVEVLRSYATGDVTSGGATSYSGGFAGRINQSSVAESYATGSVNGVGIAGGFVGFVQGGNGNVVNSYALGDVTNNSGSGTSGGFVGRVGSGSITAGYSSGEVTGTTVLGFAGIVDANGTVENSYWNIDTSGRSQSAGGTGLSNTAFQQQASFTGFNFDDIWEIDEENSFPYLQNNEQDPLPGPPDGFEPPVFAGGDGSAGDPYQIANEDHLNAVRDFQSFNFVLIDDIDLGGDDPSGPFWNDGEGWVPLGTTTSAFTGNFDGNGFEISGLYINRTGSAGQFGSLFGVMLGASVTDLVITGGSVTGGQNAALLAGQITDGTISGITLSGEVNGSGQMGSLAAIVQGTSVVSDIDSSAEVGLAGSVQNAVGGILYRLSNTSSLTSARFTGSIRGGVNTGGIAAETTGSAQILEVLSAGEISGGQNTGGIVGNHTGSAAVRNAISVGRISATGSNPAGGIAGFAGGSTEISESYFAGSVEAETTAAIAGNAGGTITNTFWSTQINAAEGSGGGTGLTSAAMKLEASFTGFDFSEIGPWSIREGITLPYLKIFDNYKTAGPDVPGHSVNDGNGWRLFTVASENASLRDFLSGLWTQGFPGAGTENGTPNVYLFDDTDGWIPAASINQIVEPGTGISMFLYADDNFDGSPDPFPKGPLASGFLLDSDISVSIPEPGVDNSFALAGNSFLWPVDADLFDTSGLTGTVYVYDSSIPGYISWNGAAGDLTDGIIAPFQGFFVEADDASPSLTIPVGAQIPDSQADFYNEPEPLPFLRLQAENGQNLKGSFWLSFAGSEFRDSRFLSPMDFRPYMEIAAVRGQTMISTFTADADLTQELSVPLSLHCMDTTENGWEPEACTTEITWSGLESLPDYWEVILQDHQAGRVFDLRETERISLELNPDSKNLAARSYNGPEPEVLKSDQDQRFSLVIIPGDPLNTGPGGELPETVVLHQNYPNPFNPVTHIQYGIPETGHVRIEVFNIAGQRVLTLVDGMVNAGYHHVTLDGSRLSSGVYIYRITAPGNTLTRKMTLLK